MDADYMFSSVREIRAVQEQQQQLEKQNQQLRTDLRDAVRLLREKTIVYIQEYNGPQRPSMDSEVHHFLNRPSVKAALK